MKRHLIRVNAPLPPVAEEASDGAWVLYGDAIEHTRAALAADRARIAAAIREELAFPSGIPDTASAILSRLLRVVEGG